MGAWQRMHFRSMSSALDGVALLSALTTARQMTSREELAMAVELQRPKGETSRPAVSRMAVAREELLWHSAQTEDVAKSPEKRDRGAGSRPKEQAAPSAAGRTLRDIATKKNTIVARADSMLPSRRLLAPLPCIILDLPLVRNGRHGPRSVFVEPHSGPRYAIASLLTHPRTLGSRSCH
jgi:hypothetical protein